MSDETIGVLNATREELRKLSNIESPFSAKPDGSYTRDEDVIAQCIGQPLLLARIEDTRLHLTFPGGTLTLDDQGADCCATHYITCDDDLARVGGDLVYVRVDDAPSIEDPNGECHDVEFLTVRTTTDTFQCANHNEHNGYYGGFQVVPFWTPNTADDHG